MTKSIRPSDGHALRVFTDIPQVEEFLTRPEFVLSKENSTLPYRLSVFFFGKGQLSLDRNKLLTSVYVKH